MSKSFLTTTEAPNWCPSPSAKGGDSPELSNPENQGPRPEALTPNRRPPQAPPSPTAWLNPQLIRLADPAAVADWVAAELLAERRQRPQRPLGLATGRTMEPIYARLAQLVWGLAPAQQQDLRNRWSSFNLDDYVGLAPTDPRSFKAEMGSRLGLPLGLDPERVHLPDGGAADPEAAACDYAKALAAAGGIGLQLLGLGLNGHVGFNEPPCGPESRCRVLNLSATTRQQNAAGFGGDPELVPRRAITLGLAEILAAERILLVVTGAAKAEVLARLLLQPPTPALPASWIKLHPAAVVVADEAALGGPRSALQGY